MRRRWERSLTHSGTYLIPFWERSTLITGKNLKHLLNPSEILQNKIENINLSLILIVGLWLSTLLQHTLICFKINCLIFITLIYIKYIHLASVFLSARLPCLAVFSRQDKFALSLWEATTASWLLDKPGPINKARKTEAHTFSSGRRSCVTHKFSFYWPRCARFPKISPKTFNCN